MSSQEHQTKQTPEGWYCELCTQTFQNPPTGECPGVKVYAYPAIQWEVMTTYTQLKAQKLKPRDVTQPDGCYYRRDNQYIFLYKIEEAVDRRVPTERQQQAISKMQAGLKKRYTCQRCGWYDRTHGKSRSRYYQGGVYMLKVNGEERFFCEDCRRYVIWCHDRHAIEHNMAIWLADDSEAPDFIVLDTETTSLPDHPVFQIVEIAAVDRTGAVIFHSLVKPDAPITPGAHAKHGLKDEDLANAPSFPEIWTTLLKILSQYEIWTYNADFDLDAILSTAARFGIEVPKRIRNPDRWHCLMETFATYYGMYSAYHNSYKWQELGFACDHLDVPASGYHRAVEDAMNGLGIMKSLAARGGTYPVPEEQPEYIRSEYYGDYDDDY